MGSTQASVRELVLPRRVRDRLDRAMALLDALFDQLRTGGAEVMQEPTDQPYGVRDCAFRDPAGNTVRINGTR